LALFKISKGLKSKLPTTYNEGYCYFTTDDGKMYIDTSNASSGRVCLNAAKADKLATARTITLSGDASGSVSFDGSKNVTLTVDIEELDNIKEAIDTKQATITGAATTITSSNLTASRALVSNSSGKVAVSAVTSTELGYLDGVTSNI